MTVTNIILIVVILILTIYYSKEKLRQKPQMDDIPQRESVKLKVSNSDVMQVIKETINNFRPFIESKGAQLNIKCTPESMMGWTDTDMTEYILAFIMTGIARKATAGRRIMVDVNTNSTYDSITTRFNDNGPELTGINPVIVKYMVRTLNGSIRFQYFEGQGNSIVMQIPLKKNSIPADQPMEKDQQAFNIPNNIELNVPTIQLPTNYKEGGSPLDAIIHQAYASTDQEYLLRAIRCVNEHITDADYDREAFANDMGSSISTLYNKIRAITGKSITNFIRDIRIKQACKLAKENPNLRVSDIAYQVGFKDPKYFATSFKRVMGMQPKEYLSLQQPKATESQQAIEQ